MTKEIKLEGCGVHTMMHYLKALGIFKILSYKYPDIRSRWSNSTFYIEVPDSVSKDTLVEFFQKEYCPTPMVSPWNNGSGFFESKKSKKPKANENLEWIENSNMPRFQEYVRAIKETRNILSSIKHDNEPITKSGEIKNSIKKLKKPVFAKIKYDILRECRNKLPDATVAYLDTVYALTSNKPAYNPILGTGANDGNSEFVNSFMGNLKTVFENLDDKTNDHIKGSLCGTFAKMDEGLLGQYNPGQQIGPNMSNTDVDGTSLVNPWDYILMMEGAIVFAGSVTRRLSRESTSKASFPFVTDHTMAGDPTTSYAETKKKELPRGEVWIPIWERKTGFVEMQHVFREGRVVLGKKHATNGSEFARAVISLGIERGISKFHRFVIRPRNGKAYFMMHAGIFIARRNKSADLLNELDSWIEKIRRIKNKPNTIGNNLKSLQDSIFDLASHQEHPSNLQKILIKIGDLDMNLSISKRNESFPVLLTPKWIKYCYDDSAEFRLAASLASIVGDNPKIGPIRTNIEKIKIERNKQIWGRNNSTVSKKNSHYKYIASILERRCLDAIKTDAEFLSLAGIVPAHIQDILDFLHGRLDVSKIVKLLIPLSFIDYTQDIDVPWDNRRDIVDEFRYLPYAFAVLKMNFWPYKYDDDKYLPFSSQILSSLRAGRMDDAFNFAQKRLLHSGLVPLLRSEYAGLPDTFNERIESALLFPIHQKTMKKIIDSVLQKTAVLHG